MPNLNTPDFWKATWAANADKYGSDPFHVVRFRFVASLCTASKSLLEVASGPGWLSDYLPNTVRYDRLDFCEDALKLKPGRYFVADLLNCPDLSEKWDSVAALEILEHVEDPGRIISFCVRHCTDQAIFSVPNNRLGPDQEPLHLAKYNIDSFRDLFFTLGYTGFFTIFVLEGNLICRIRI